MMLVCAALEGKGANWHWSGKSIGLFAGSVLLLWPAAFLKLSFLKAYLFMAYLAVFRKSPWGHITFLDTWRLRFEQSPGEWLLLAIAVILCFRFCDSAMRRLLTPVLLFAGLMLIALLRVNTETPRYMLPFLPAMQLAAGFIFASTLKNANPLVRNASAAAICLLLFLNTGAQIRAHPIRPAPRLAKLLATLRNQDLTNKKLLVPQDDLPMIHYYLPNILLSGYVSEEERSAMLARERFDAVLDRDKLTASHTKLLNDER